MAAVLTSAPTAQGHLNVDVSQAFSSPVTECPVKVTKFNCVYFWDCLFLMSGYFICCRMVTVSCLGVCESSFLSLFDIV